MIGAGRRIALVLAVAVLLGLPGCAGREPPPGDASLPVSAQEVSADRAIISVRRVAAGSPELVLTPRPSGAVVMRPATASDLHWVWDVSGLAPETSYAYRVKVGVAAAEGHFRTAPARDVATPVRFAWGGDIAGQNVCRDVARDLPIFTPIREARPQFFVGLGDMIYADNPCDAMGRYGNAQRPDLREAATTPEAFGAKWDYVRGDPGVRRLLAETTYYAVWDDHEVVNDFAPETAGARYSPARAAFAAYNPVEVDSPFYRSRRWGRHVELFILDTRSYRDPNLARDQPGKSLLGDTQRDWLIEGVTRSDATWKVVISSVPVSIPTGYPVENGRDGWASGDGETGFETELRVVLTAFAKEGVRNLVFLTTDVHHATGFRYQPLPQYPEFEFHEFVTGPLNAGVFPGFGLDTSFNPQRLFLHSPQRAEDISTFEEALGWFNFGLVDIDSNGRFEQRVINARGLEIARTSLLPR